MLVIPSVSKRFISVPVSGDGLDDADPVEIAIVGTGVEEPADDDWVEATFDGGLAKVLIGPETDFELEDGIYRIWVRVSAPPERPVMRSGLLKIT